MKSVSVRKLTLGNGGRRWLLGLVLSSIMNFSIRSYQPKDWQGICRVHDAARLLEVKNFIPEGVTLPMKQAVEEDGAFFESDVFVAVSEEDVLGFIAVQGDELTWLYIHPDYHRRGVATQLVNSIRNSLGQHGFVLCAKENEYGFKFYQKVGFRPVAYFPGNERGYPCICVRLTLPGSIHAERKPRPTISSLIAHGYSEENWGKAIRDKDGIWYWVR